MHPRMSKFTLANLEKRVGERAKASAKESYTRALLDKGVAHCAKKLDEEAFETGLAAVQENKRRVIAEAADLLYHLAGRAESARRHAGGGRGRARQTHQAERASRKRRRDEEKKLDGTAHRRNAFALPHVLARGMGGVARRHADDADLGGGHAPALAARPARHQGSRGDLSVAVAAALALCGGDAAAVPRAGALPRHRGRQDAVHHRRRRLGGGRKIDHRARAAGAAGALAERAQGRSHHHRRLSLSERDSRARRPDGEEGLSGKLRPAGAAACFSPT